MTRKTAAATAESSPPAAVVPSPSSADWARFWSKAHATTGGCWIWQQHLVDGYGMFTFNGADRGAHRIAYEMLIGSIPPGLQIDHLCRQRACVNPGHLEPVTQLENIRRAPWVRVTHCKRGHLLPLKPNKFGDRNCLTCHREVNRRWRLARRAA